jgi:hypothetical protein
MPKIKCNCGEVLRYGDIPCKIEYLFMPDVEYDNFDEPLDPNLLYLKMKSFLKCPTCKRLWVFWNGFDEQPEEYTLNS